MAGYLCAECGSRMRHVETQPGRFRWVCSKRKDCGWECSDATAAMWCEEDPGDDRTMLPEAELTRGEVQAADRLPSERFYVEGEAAIQHTSSLTSEGERPPHVTSRPLGGDPEQAVRVEELAAERGEEVTDANIERYRSDTYEPDPKPKAADRKSAAAKAGYDVEAAEEARKEQQAADAKAGK